MLWIVAVAAVAVAPFGRGKADHGAYVQPLIHGSRNAVVLCARIADDPFSRARGVVGHPPLERGQAVAFVYARARRVRFTFARTVPALDIAFVGPSGRVRATHTHVLGGRPEPLHSPGPVALVVETAAGELDRIGVRVGDRLTLGGAYANGRLVPASLSGRAACSRQACAAAITRRLRERSVSSAIRPTCQ